MQTKIFNSICIISALGRYSIINSITSSCSTTNHFFKLTLEKLIMELIRVGVIEDDKVIHHSLVSSIEMYPALELAFDAFSVEEALEQFQEVQLPVDVILLDIGLPGMDGITGIPHIKKKLEKTDIIMLTAFDESERIFKALCAGACSYISKKTSLKVIMDAVFTVYRGGSYMSPAVARKIAQHFAPLAKKNNSDKLTSRQMEIVSGLSEGLSYKLIGDKFGISMNTVRAHIKNIYKTLEVNSKIEVINMYRDGDLNPI